jgi:serine/threonine-protein kinase
MSRPTSPHRDAVTAAAVRRPAAPAPGPVAGETPERAPSPAPFPLVVPDQEGARRAGAVVGGRYELVERIGRGGMGEVWRARHVTLQTEAAVKFPALAARGVAAAAVLERFRFEAQVAARLGLASRHVVRVHDAGEGPDGPYLAMEYVRGRTLEQEIDDKAALPLPWVAGVVAQVAEALTVAHAYGVVHRDLKPSNLLLGTDGGGALLVKVADFGIAKALGIDLGADLPEDTEGGVMIGSPPYMSPELLAGGAASAEGDLWSLGVIAYEALTGRLPFAGRSFAALLASHAGGRFDVPSAVRPGIPAAVDAWFRRALAKDKGRRFRDARGLSAALTEAAGEAPRRGWAARLLSRG